jgi:hypothetical protein
MHLIQLTKETTVEPSHKSEAVEADIKRIFGIDRRESIRQGICPMCDSPADVFRDSLSRKEYMISGLCQACQDIAFAEPSDWDSVDTDL